ncbi:MAG: tRNA (adenosine(37)-N6)-threonylcarbamoyltransferase complex dimerization subunit type 1 TsaB, partial [Phycisphaerae bacterium]|nr:tRNA (adenosine(37)-N6)-threonylcarbamoyltransferase complex dimerization subunit type 1 TsaB [Phycisphaerae bacterium]
MSSDGRAPAADGAEGGARTAVLAIELSQRAGSVALRVGGLASARAVPAATSDRDELMPAIQALVRDAGCTPRDIDTVMVSIGPGGFTGLRVSIATAKALSLALGARLVGVPSALIVARCIAQRDGIRDGTVGVALAVKADTAWLERVELAGGEP